MSEREKKFQSTCTLTFQVHYHVWAPHKHGLTSHKHEVVRLFVAKFIFWVGGGGGWMFLGGRLVPGVPTIVFVC